MAGIGIILNPHSRSNRQNPERIERLSFIVGDKGSCRATRDVADLKTVAAEFKSRNVEILGISGGDGTIHHTLTTFLEEYQDTPLPKIALLRGGTMNNVASACDIHGSPEQILSNLILKYHENHDFQTTKLDMMKVNGKYGFLFGNGVVCRFLEEYYKLKSPGPAAAFMLLVKVVTSAVFHTRYTLGLAKRFDAEVIADGEKWNFKNYVFIDAGTIETFGMGFDPFYRARSKPGYFHILGCSGTPRTLFYDFPAILMRKPPSPKRYIDVMAKKVEIKLEKPQTYTLDGEILPATDHLVIESGPELTMVVR